MLLAPTMVATISLSLSSQRYLALFSYFPVCSCAQTPLLRFLAGFLLRYLAFSLCCGIYRSSLSLKFKLLDLPYLNSWSFQALGAATLESCRVIPELSLQ